MRILYVEDNPANLFLVQRVARMGNHEIIHYDQGQPALDRFRDDNPDLVLMDIQLPGTLTGLDVVKALRAAGHRTPIIAVTAYAMSGDRERCLEAGCDGYLAKPLPVGELVELFRRYEPAVKAPPAAPPAAPVAATPAPAASEDTPAEPKPVESAPELPVAKEADTSGDETIPSRPTLEMKAAPAEPASPADSSAAAETPAEPAAAVDAPAEPPAAEKPTEPETPPQPTGTAPDEKPILEHGVTSSADTPAMTNGKSEPVKAEQKK